MSKMIYYWNQDYFEGLKEIGDAYSQRSGFEHFGEYCLKKAAGLKKQANELSKVFVSEVEQRTTSEQRDTVVRLCELDHAHEKVHSLINHHLSKLIQETLFKWSESEPSSIVSHRWEALYGRYDRSSAALETALSIDPDDQVVVVRKCNSIIHELGFMTHHLDEDILLGEVINAHSMLAQLRPVVSRVSDPALKGRLEDELSYFTQLFELWKTHQSESDSKKFLEWAKETADFDW